MLNQISFDTNLLVLLQEFDMYSFGQFSAQALEIMVSILTGNFPEWVENRGGYHSFSRHFCGEGSFGKRRVGTYRLTAERQLADFSQSLAGYRIESMNPLPIDATQRGQQDNRFIIITLKHQSKLDVIVKINFDELGSYGEVHGATWGEWVLSGEKTILCKQHPDARFNGQIVLENASASALRRML